MQTVGPGIWRESSAFQTKKAQWDNEKALIEKVQKLREELENVKKEIAQAQQQYDLNKAAELQYGKLPQIQKQLEAEEERLKMEDLSLMHENVSEEEIARIMPDALMERPTIENIMLGKIERGNASWQL